MSMHNGTWCEIAVSKLILYEKVYSTLNDTVLEKGPIRQSNEWDFAEQDVTMPTFYSTLQNVFREGLGSGVP